MFIAIAVLGALLGLALLLWGPGKLILGGLVISALVWLWSLIDARATARGQTKATRGLVRWVLVAGIGALWWSGIGTSALARVARTWTVTSRSMTPALLEGDHVSGTLFRGGTIERGQIVVHKWPEDQLVFINRVVGTPGDTLEMSAWTLLINGQSLEDHSFLSDTTAETHPWMEWQAEFVVRGNAGEPYEPNTASWGPIVVPEGSYFVLGDHRNASLDSRYRGFVPVSDILALAGRIYWSWDSESFSVRLERIGQNL